ncbi:MAG TPA: response regulator [Chitinophagaceae bacterium]|nr:response regulator [Chitinophagaceae bacterium]
MKRILIVDDNIEILDVLEVAFEGQGFEVCKISEGKKVFEAVKEFSPNIILLDVYLDDINGVTICNELKSQSETKHIPIVMFSAHTNAETVLKACTAEAFVGKPFNIHSLTELIETHLNKVA